MRTSNPPSAVSARTAPVRRGGRRILAAVLATALATVGMTAVVAAPAQAAGPAVSVPEAPAAGGTITLTGSGFAGVSPGIYLGVGPAGLAGFYPGSGSLVASETVWVAPGNADGTGAAGRTAPMAADGSFSVTVTIPAPSTSVPAYSIYTSKAHGQGMSDPSQNTTTAVTFAKAAPTATSLALTASSSSVTEGAPVTFTATVSPAAAGMVAFSDGSTSLGTVSVSGSTAAFTGPLSVGLHSVTAAFTPTDPDAFAGSTSGAVTVTVTAAGQPAAAAVSVSPATGLDPAGSPITVTGSAFKPTGGVVQGVYVGVGPKSAKSDPSWFVNAGFYQGVQWVRTIGADGSFTQALSGVKSVFTSNGTQVDCLAEECGVYTFAAHGSSDRSQDTYTPIAFQAPAVAPAVTTLTVTTSAASSAAGAGVDVTVAVSPVAAGTVDVLDGTRVAARNLALKDGKATTRLSSLAAGARALGATFAPADPTAFAPSVAAVVTHTVTAAVTTVPPVTGGVASAATTQAEPVCVARAVSGATLQWGVKSSFRNYISGGIANGSWTLSGVGYESGRYTWSGGSGSYNAADGKGTVRFPGSVSFTGHGGVLNLVLSNLGIRVSGPGSATITADVHSTDMSGAASEHPGVSFATVALGGSGASGATPTATDAPVTLTAAGAEAFAGFYTAGTALDPVSFRLPLGATVPCDSSTAANLATTGGGDTGAWPILGGLMLLVGIAAVSAARRRIATPAPAARA
ncbi:HtaA domain-containing protein [Leifsonia poae]|uniref:HtaA domain-containing protein n=1 Tax=Leifsonia poae TaxID=110933 RepID=UPI001CBB986C|nr:HtaA domain-containing protein [Leifsonia poae]